MFSVVFIFYDVLIDRYVIGSNYSNHYANHHSNHYALIQELLFQLHVSIIYLLTNICQIYVEISRYIIEPLFVCYVNDECEVI